MLKSIHLEVNGTGHQVQVDPDRSLLSVLRYELGLTGSKFGCGEGECGCCTVLLGEKPIRSCITAAGEAEGKPITTIEGLAHGDRLHPLQEAFIEQGALQCGYCTAGMIMSAAGLLRRNPHPNEAEIIQAMQGNICRCGTYRHIIRAIQQAAHSTRSANP